MNLLKTITILTISVTAAGALLFGGTFIDIADTAWRRTTEAAHDALGQDFELDMVETQLGEQSERIAEMRTRIAGLQVSCEDLRSELEHLTEERRSSLSALRSLTAAYEATGLGERAAVLNGRTINPEVVAADLRRTTARSDLLAQSLEIKTDLLQRRESALSQARNALDQFVGRHQRLEVALESRRIDLESVRLLQEQTPEIDDGSQLDEIQERLDRVGKEIRVNRLVAEDASRIDLARTPTSRDGQHAYHTAMERLGNSATDTASLLRRD